MDTIHNHSKKEITRFSNNWSGIRYYIQVMRIDHWFKNVFTFIGVVGYLAYSKENFTTFKLFHVVLAILLSCFVSSINYVINEILDASYDLLHPRKKNRPIPAGKVNINVLCAIIAFLLIFSYSLAVTFFSTRFVLVLFLLFFFGLMYNVKPLRAKEIPYIDVIVESANNPIRVAIGWFALAPLRTSLPFSVVLFFWVFGAFLMTGKRLAEMRFLGEKALPYRITFQYYSQVSLIIAMALYSLTSIFIYLYLILKVFDYNHFHVLGLGLLIIFYSWCFKLAWEEDGILKEPETLLKKPVFLIFCVTGLIIVLLIFLL